MPVNVSEFNRNNAAARGLRPAAFVGLAWLIFYMLIMIEGLRAMHPASQVAGVQSAASHTPLDRELSIHRPESERVVSSFAQ